jgi:hypothetical protein
MDSTGQPPVGHRRGRTEPGVIRAPRSGASDARGDHERDAFVEQVAARLIARQLQIPALLAIESVRPFARIAAHGLVFLNPLLALLVPGESLARASRLIGDPARLAALAAALERDTPGGRASDPRMR